MQKAGKPAAIHPKELHALVIRGEEFTLIDTLPEDHYVKRHLPGAQNACVYQVVFPARVASLVPDKGRHVILYGASARSLDAITAAEKLLRLGYENVTALSGGLKGWAEEGLPVEGLDPATVDEPEALQVVDGVYRIDTARSFIEWAGRNVGTKHLGTLRLSQGRIDVKGGEVAGSFEIDMASIKNDNLDGDPLQSVLIAHLLSDDFFFVERFPRATFIIDTARWRDPRSLSAPNLDIGGTLDLHGFRKPLFFEATMGRLDDGSLAAEAHFDIDRTEWGIVYGSSRFFEHLGMHLVFDIISFQVRIVAR